MRKSNKKGFTIVELVIVIAVIAVLAGVLVPVFSGVINNANKSAASQEIGNEWTAYLVAKKGDVSATNSYIAIYNKAGSSDYYAMAIIKGQKASDYISDKASSASAAITNLNSKLNGKTIGGNTFKNTTTYNTIVQSNTTDITNGVEGCSDGVKVYLAKIGNFTPA